MFKYKQFGNSGKIYSLLEKNVYSDLNKQDANVQNSRNTLSLSCSSTVALLFLTEKYFECSSKQTMFHSPSLSECKRLMDLDDESWLQRKHARKYKKSFRLLVLKINLSKPILFGTVCLYTDRDIVHILNIWT